MKNIEKGGTPMSEEPGMTEPSREDIEESEYLKKLEVRMETRRLGSDLIKKGQYVEGLRELQKTESPFHHHKALEALGMDLLQRGDVEQADNIIRDAAGTNEELRKEYQKFFYESLGYRYANMGNLKDALRMVMKIEDEDKLQRSLYLVVRNWLAGRAGGLEGAAKEGRFREALDAVPLLIVMRVRDICHEYRGEQMEEVLYVDEILRQEEESKN
ncbi:MAG: hypothetical protein A2679_00935 [Candidatus Sungbacteria bacterium RIFCSPHIGHO2_01_FULL_54_26]|nr:MAG: hypothetical protein A2679_00935 [Candidatus Sungbacteria bacterium RIFCSPHIGHO2_01_FULL_54_26]